MANTGLFVQITLDSETIGGGWKLYHYIPGTTNLKDVWVDHAKGTPAAQPVVADANGVVSFYADGLYDLVVYNSADVLKYTWSNVFAAETSNTFSEGGTLASGASVTLSAVASEVYNHISGSVTILGLSGSQPFVILTFDGAPILTDSGTFQLRNRTTRTIRTDETVMFVNDGAGVWREVAPPLRLGNDVYLTGRNAAGNAEVNLIKVGTTDKIEFGTTVKNFAVDADPSSALQVATKQYVDALATPSITGFTTGDVKLTFKTVADTLWVMMDDKTIGDATSGATGRANADTEALYTLLWNNVVNQWAPVTGGRGANAAADFAAHKPLALPKALGRALAGYGTGTTIGSGGSSAVDLTNDDFTVLSNNATWITGMPVVFTLDSGTITGLTSGNTYYIIRESSTKVRLAATLDDAQQGNRINLTAKSSPEWVLTHTYTTRALGETQGEEAHAQSITELVRHHHTTSLASSDTSAADTGQINWSRASNQFGSTDVQASDAGVSGLTNNLQPSLFLNVMIKL